MKRAWIALLAVLAMLVCLSALADYDFMLQENKYTLFEGETVQLGLLRQGDATTGEVTWKSSAMKVCTVSADGVVTALSKGTAKVTASVRVGNRTLTTSAQITVQRPVRDIEVSEKGLTVYDCTDAALDGLLNLDGDERVLVLRTGSSAVGIRATVSPRDASNAKYTLTSSNEQILAVTGTNIRALKAGECFLTVASVLNPEVEVTYHVLVTQPVKGITLTADSTVIGKGGTTVVRAQVTPADATFTAVTWTSLTPKIISVDQNGLVTGLSKGTGTVRADAADGSKHYATLRINVEQPPTSITLKENNISLPTGTYRSLSATVQPANANRKNVIWTSSDEGVATVNQYGRVTGVRAGTCQIVCSSEVDRGIYAVCEVRVVQRVTRITFNETSVTVNVGDTVRVHWNTEPSDATDPSVTLTSSKTAVATVDQDGTVHGIKRGECYINAKANDGSGRTARVKVEVLQPVYGVHMRNDTYTVGVDETVTIHAVLEPSDASNRRMSWTVDDPYIATISGRYNNPGVTGLHWGTVTVTGVTEDGGYTTSARVKVGSYNKALRPEDLYLDSNNQIRMTVRNLSNMNITRFTFMLTCYGVDDTPIPCNVSGSATFRGSYRHTLTEGMTTVHGRFTFTDFAQPTKVIGRMSMHLLGYTCDDGFSYTYRESEMPGIEYRSPLWVGTPTPVPPPPTPAPNETTGG